MKNKNDYNIIILVFAGVLSILILIGMYFLLSEESDIDAEEVAHEISKEIIESYETQKSASSIKYYSRDEVVIEDEGYITWRNARFPDANKIIEEHPWITADKSVPKNLISFASQYINLCDKDFIKYLMMDGWTFHLTSDPIYLKLNPNATANGVTNRYDKTIIIYADEKAIKDATLHEIGHVFYYYNIEDFDENGIDSIDYPELKKIKCYGAEFSYIYENFSEMIAQSYMTAILYPKEVEAQAPTLFEIYDIEQY